MIRKTAKTTSLVLVMAITMSMFTGCGKKNESYREIVVSETNGTTVITRDAKENFDAYAGMHLLTGDDARVGLTADMTLELDSDKYVYAEENTHFYITADGKEGSTKSVINLDEGSVLIRVANKLGGEETFEVVTPNSTMAVRGTVFRISVGCDENNQLETSVQTFEGAVYAALKDEKGQLTENGIEVKEGEQSEVITNSEGINEYTEIVPVSTKNLPEGTKAKLQEFADNGAKLIYSDDDLLSVYEKQQELKSHWQLISSYRDDDIDKYIFNEAGLVASVDFGPGFRENYEYGDSNELLYFESIEVNYENKEVKNCTFYNPDGTVSERLFYGNTDTHYSYYPDKTLKREETFVNPAAFFGDSKYANEWQYFESADYDEKGNVIYEETYLTLYDFVNDPVLYKYNYSYDYDSEGRMLCKRTDYDTTYYEYDEYGNLVYSYKILNETGEKAYEDEQSYKYEYVDGKMKSATYTITYNEEGNCFSEGVDNYDENGNKILGYNNTTYVDDDGNPWPDAWIDSFEYEYQYDEYGNEILYRYKTAYDDEQGIKSYDQPEFPEGNVGDLFTRTVTMTYTYGAEESVSRMIEIYRYY